MNKKFLFVLSLLVIASMVLAACGGSPPPARETVALGLHQEVNLRSLSDTSAVNEVKVVFTAKLSGDQSQFFYGQVFLDEDLLKAQEIFSESETAILPGLAAKAKISTEQVEVLYDPDLWEVVPN